MCITGVLGLFDCLTFIPAVSYDSLTAELLIFSVPIVYEKYKVSTYLF